MSIAELIMSGDDEVYTVWPDLLEIKDSTGVRYFKYDEKHLLLQLSTISDFEFSNYIIIITEGKNSFMFCHLNFNKKEK